MLSAIGLEGRAPRKLDFRYNFAVSGAVCADLVEGDDRQVQRLTYLMKKDPSRWRNGLIVVRIGVNSFGQTEHLEEFAKSGLSSESRAGVLKCANDVRAAVRAIRAEFPLARLVLVGILDNSDWARNLSKWKSPIELARIREALDLYDNELRAIVRGDGYAAFFDDRKWFAQHWGGRDANGLPAYRSVSLGEALVVTNTQGDAPTNAVVEDGHAGTIWNGLWAAGLIDLVNREFGMHIEPISETEIVDLIKDASPTSGAQ